MCRSRGKSDAQYFFIHCESDVNVVVDSTDYVRWKLGYVCAVCDVNHVIVGHLMLSTFHAGNSDFRAEINCIYLMAPSHHDV